MFFPPVPDLPAWEVKSLPVQFSISPRIDLTMQVGLPRGYISNDGYVSFNLLHSYVNGWELNGETVGFVYNSGRRFPTQQVEHRLASLCEPLRASLYASQLEAWGDELKDRLANLFGGVSPVSQVRLVNHVNLWLSQQTQTLELDRPLPPGDEAMEKLSQLWH